MAQEPLTLYKLMILYMLDSLKIPLTISQLSEFFVIKRYTSYFHMQQSVNDLCDAGFISREPVRKSSRFHLTESGKEALDMFGHKIPDAIKEDIRAYYYSMRRELEFSSDFFPDQKGHYTVRARISENDITLLELTVSTYAREEAMSICDRWNSRDENYYHSLMASLLS